MVEQRRLNRRKGLRRLLKPQHIVFVGGRTCLPAIEMARRAGFDGAIWIVHPTYETLGGLPVINRINDLPSAPDAAFLNVPKAATFKVVEQLDAIGTGGAVCFAAGFSEIGTQGETLQQQLVESAGNLALVGPNSNGLLNNFDKVALWPTDDHVVPELHRGVAIVSQSGGLLYNYTSDQRSLRPGYLIGVGNQAVLDMSDFVDAALDDKRVTAIGLFIEDIGDVSSFSEAAVRALEQEVPMVALKTGASSLGALVAQTHSGALVADDDLYRALFKRLGVIRVPSLAAFDETLKMLTTTRRPRGRRIAVLTNSGGEKAMAADASNGTVLEFPQPSPQATQSLKEQIPEFASVSNPFDYNDYYPGSGPDVLSPDNPHLLERCFRTLIEDGYDIAVMLMGFRTFADGLISDRSATMDAWIDANHDARHATVLASILPEHLPRPQREQLIDNQIAPLQGLPEAMLAIDAAVRWSEFIDNTKNFDVHQLVLPRPQLLLGTTELIDEASSKQRLKRFGLTTPNSMRCAPEDIEHSSLKLEFPVVVKVLKPVLAHKHQVGGVALAIEDIHELKLAIQDMRDSLKGVNLSLDEVLIEPMVTNKKAELFMGVKYHRQFGHALVLGLGGTEVETLGQVTTLLLPATPQQINQYADETLRNLKLSVAQLMGVTQSLEAIAAFVRDTGEHLTALDVNPLIVTNQDAVIAVDALIEQVQPA